jgi:hypothetical protein
MKKLALINKSTNICENISLDRREAHQIIIDEFLVIDLEKTLVINWVWDDLLNDFKQIESKGNGGIGDLFLNGTLIKTKLEKEKIEEFKDSINKEQPVAVGLDEI